MEHLSFYSLTKVRFALRVLIGYILQSGTIFLTFSRLFVSPWSLLFSYNDSEIIFIITLIKFITQNLFINIQIGIYNKPWRMEISIST